MKVSIVVLSYNQSSYIRRALDGILSQDIVDDCEIIIADDCSIDDTAIICREYEKKFSNIHFEKNEKNLGYYGNWIRAMSLGSCEYIALFEADDFWIYSSKLKKQVEFLDMHRECALCYTDFNIYYEDLDYIDHDVLTNAGKKILSNDPLSFDGYCGNVSWVLRKSNLNSINIPVGCMDVPLAILYELCKAFEIGCLPITSSVYRIHKNSYSSSENIENIYKYSKSIFYLQKLYVAFFENSKKNEETIFFRALIHLYPTAVKLKDIDLINEIDNYFQQRHLKDIFTYVKDIRESSFSIKKSKDYKLGHYLLLPFRVVKKYFN